MSTVRRLYVSVRASNRHAIRGLRQVGDEADMAEGSLGTLDSRTRMLETSFFALGAATAAVGYGIMRIAQAGMAVGTTLRMVQATSGATAAEMNLIRQEVQRLGKELPVSSADAANAMKELSFAGLDASQSIAAVGAVAELASASTLTVAESAEITSNALNQFSLQADQAAAVADLAAGAFSSSSMTMQEFAESMNYVGNAAATAGFNITETTAALSVLANSGLKGSRAGTSLAAALTQLASPSENAAEALESVGLSVSSFTDEEGNFKSMAEIAGILNENLSGLPEAQQLQVLTDVFGIRGARAMSALMENTKELDAQLMSLSASQLKGAMDAVSEADPAGIREINTELRNLEGMAATAQLTPSMNTQQMLSEFQSVSGQLSEEELAVQIGTAFDVDTEAATRMAAELQMGTDVGVIADELQRAQDAGGLTAAQMSTLSGKLEYLRGTLESISFSMFTGMRPILTGIADAAIVVVDVLAEHETAAKAAGVAMFFLLGALGTAATLMGLMVLETKAAVTWQYASAQGAYTHAAAQKASSAASWLATTARNALTLSYWRGVAATTRSTGALVANTAVKYGSMAASYAAAAGTYVLSGGLAASAAAAWALMTPLWPLLAVGLAIAGLFYMWQSNTLGLRSALSGAAGTLMSFLSPVERFHSLLKMLTSFDVSDIPLIGGMLKAGMNVVGAVGGLLGGGAKGPAAIGGAPTGGAPARTGRGQGRPAAGRSPAVDVTTSGEGDKNVDVSIQQENHFRGGDNQNVQDQLHRSNRELVQDLEHLFQNGSGV